MRTRCVGCGAELPATGGPVHRCLESSPACGAAVGLVPGREGSDPAWLAVHLIRLCLILERDRSTAEAVAATPAEQAARVTARAREAWQAWAPHHAQVRAWLPGATGRRT